MNEDNMLESAVANALPPSSGPRGWGPALQQADRAARLTFHHKRKQHGSVLYAGYQTPNFFMPVTLLIRILEIFMKNVRGRFNKTGEL